ncbi:MAG: polysaccharide biosynthesis tyrosine autokinase, partial [Myxococcaceae bacterium]|nr:polysaccharide biosynthesis tyrosine autokinase [Myxococcaceae bacterium]
RERFTESHPTVSALRKKMAQVRTERAAIEERMKSLPEAELSSARLMRDVKVNNELYLLLLNRAQELRVVKSGTVGNVRIIDRAELQEQRVAPQRGRIALSSLLVGAMLGVGVVLLQRALFRGVEDPDRLEQELGVSVYASIPHSPKQAEMNRSAERRRKVTLTPLAVLEPDGPALESLRSLRTSLQFALAEARTNLIAIGGPRPGVGKTFVSVNLAHVLSDSGKRVLLVDADMRKGQLHRYFGLERVTGLSELIRGSAELEAALRPGPSANLSFITTGAIPPNPSELLASTRFRQLVEAMSRRFDIAVLDAPPILAVTDATLIAQAAGVNLLVLRSGLHPMRELALAVSRLKKCGVQPNGFVINDVRARSSLHGAGRYAYHYQYEYK